MPDTGLQEQVHCPIWWTYAGVGFCELTGLDAARNVYERMQCTLDSTRRSLLLDTPWRGSVQLKRLPFPRGWMYSDKFIIISCETMTHEERRSCGTYGR